MGDSLTYAREFCQNSRKDIEAIVSGICAEPCAAPDVLVSSLSSIQQGAKQVRARAIYRAAQTVVDSVLSSAAKPAIQGRVLSLNKLIAQYEQGLNEIQPCPANLDTPADTAAASASPAKTRDTTPDIPSDTHHDRFAHAREILMPLMGLARGEEQGALQTLSALSFDSQDEGPAQDTLGEAGDVFAAADKSRENAENFIEQPDSSQLVDFEILMPAFTSEALQAARHSQKTVSVSYAANDVSLSQQQADALQPVLTHIANILVSSALERPELRRARAESGSGHIALTAIKTYDELAISIECPGKTLPVSAFAPASHSVSGLSVILGSKMLGNNCAHVVLKLPSRAASEPQRSIELQEMAL